MTYHDPYVECVETDSFRLVGLKDSELDQGLAGADCVVILTDHSTYDWRRVCDQASLIVDTRNALGRIASSTEQAAKNTAHSPRESR